MRNRLLLTLLVLCFVISMAVGCTLFDKSEEQEENITKVTITFDAQGGSEITSISGEPNMKIDVPENPVKEDCVFAGWYKDKECTKPFILDFYPKQDITIYAKWTEELYKVTLEGNGGSGTTLDKTFKKGENCVLPVDWTLPGYSFDGWYVFEDLSGAKITNIDMNKDETFYAKWIANNYTIKFVSNGGTPIESITAPYQSLINEPTCKKEGFVFGGWYKDESLNIRFDFTTMPLGDVTLYAKWIQSILVTYMDGNKLLETHTMTTNTFALIDPINSSFNKPDFYFEGWYEDKELTKKCDQVVSTSQNILVYSKWQNRSFVPYINEFESHGVSNNDPILLKDKKMFISFVDYIIYNFDKEGRYVKLDYEKDLVEAGKEIYNALRYQTNNTMMLGIDNRYKNKGVYRLYVADATLAGEEQRVSGFLTIPNQERAEKFVNILVPNYSRMRSDSFDDFKYKSYEESMVVEDSNQLFYAMQYGYKPIMTEGSPADLMMKKAKDILREICDDRMNDFQKMYAIFNYLVTNVSYDIVASPPNPEEKAPFDDPNIKTESNKYDSWHIEGVLNNKLAVCDGIAKTVVLLARIEGIPCIRVTGSGHAWNKVYLDLDNNGVKEWYCLDATWGNTMVKQPTNDYAEVNVLNNFLFTDNYQAGKNRLADNHKDIVANTPVNPYKLIEMDYKNKIYDLYIENDEEIKALAGYMHEYANNDKSLINRIYSINVRLANVDRNHFIDTISSEINFLNKQVANDKNIDLGQYAFLVYNNKTQDNLVTISFKVEELRFRSALYFR